MINIIKNTQKVLFRRKSFIVTSFILPIVLVFVFTLMYSSDSTYKVALVNSDKGELGKLIEERVSNIEGITIVNEKNKDYERELVFYNIKAIIKIDENFTEDLMEGEKGEVKIQSLIHGEFEAKITELLNREVKSLSIICNNIDIESVSIDNVIETFNGFKPPISENLIEKRVNIKATLGMILYLIVVCSGITCGFLLEDEREGTKSRTLMGKVTEREYYLGVGFVSLLVTSIPILEYYFISKLFNYKFGFDNTIVFLGILLLVALLALSFNIMLCSIVKKKTVLNVINCSLMCPVFMLSGAFWSYDMMGEGLRKIGSFLPPRWVMLSVENLQMGKGIDSVIPTVVGLISMSVLFLILSVILTKNKIVWVKDN